MGRVWYGPSLSWAEFVRGRVVQLPLNFDQFWETLENLCLLEKVPQDLFHSVYFEYEENCTDDRLLSLNYAFCHIKR